MLRVLRVHGCVDEVIGSLSLPCLRMRALLQLFLLFLSDEHVLELPVGVGGAMFSVAAVVAIFLQRANYALGVPLRGRLSLMY